MGRPLVDLTNQRFGRLIVLKINGIVNTHATWDCICDCGNLKNNVDGGQLRRGNIKSCGCIVRENRQAYIKRKTKHNLTSSKEYDAWIAMKSRCFSIKNPFYNRYGAVGITVYQPWIKDFTAFYNYIGPAPKEVGVIYELDRKNPAGNYEPGNVRWWPKGKGAYRTPPGRKRK